MSAVLEKWREWLSTVPFANRWRCDVDDGDGGGDDDDDCSGGGGGGYQQDRLPTDAKTAVTYFGGRVQMLVILAPPLIALLCFGVALLCLFVYHGLWLWIGCCTLSPSPVHAARGPSREEWGKLSLQIKQSWANNKNKDKTQQYIAALLGVNEQQPQFECRSRGSGHFNGCCSLALPAAYQWTISTRLGLGLYLVKNWEVSLPTRQIYIIDRPPTPIGASQRCIWDNSLPIGFYWPANGFLLCLNATWNQPIHEVGKFLGWDCGTWHITVQYFFVV